MFNLQIIELNLKLLKSDLVFTVNAASRLREMIGVVDKKFLTIYKNDKGNLTKLYSLNLMVADFRGVTSSAVFYFQRDFLICLNKRKAYRINTRTSYIDTLPLQGTVSGKQSFFLDAQYFYFLTENEGQSGSSLGVLGTDTIETGFSNLTPTTKPEEKERLKYPSWDFTTVKRLDFDEFNATANLLTADMKVVCTPLFHRNTVQFIGMAERDFYLCFKQTEEHFYALDKQNFVNCWSIQSGKLLSKVRVVNSDYTGFDVDRQVYDKDWFKHTLIFKQQGISPRSS